MSCTLGWAGMCLTGKQGLVAMAEQGGVWGSDTRAERKKKLAGNRVQQATSIPPLVIKICGEHRVKVRLGLK